MKRKWLAIGIILLFVGTYIIPATAQDIEKPLPTSRGNWLYVGGSGLGNYTKIQDAIDNSTAGDTVFVYAGLYKENVFIRKSITLLGENRDTTIIDADRYDYPIYLMSSYVCISGFTIQNSGEDQAGIHVELNHNPWVSEQNIIIGNKIINNTYGIELYACNQSSIKNNIITQNGFGISCHDSHLLTIENNKITKNYGGIDLWYSNQNKIIKNYIDGSEEGIEIIGSSLCNISENTISNSSYFGINFRWSYSNLIDSNNFIDNKRDIRFGYLFSDVLQSNHFINNYWDRYFQIGPKAILGIWVFWMIIISFPFGFYSFPLPLPIFSLWLNFDWHPAKEPYNISGMN